MTPEHIDKHPTYIEVRPSVNPDGEAAVLLQLEFGFILLPPSEAVEVAAMILQVAEQVAEYVSFAEDTPSRSNPEEN